MVFKSEGKPRARQSSVTQACGVDFLGVKSWEKSYTKIKLRDYLSVRRGFYRNALGINCYLESSLAGIVSE